jgi:hypothetical protein
MAFKKDVMIYEKDEVRVFINQCHNPGKSTFLYSVRKDSKNSLGELLGIIKWNGAWRQYCFYPESLTFWSYGCMQEITNFLIEITQVQKEQGRKSEKLQKTR